MYNTKESHVGNGHPGSSFSERGGREAFQLRLPLIYPAHMDAAGIWHHLPNRTGKMVYRTGSHGNKEPRERQDSSLWQRGTRRDIEARRMSANPYAGRGYGPDVDPALVTRNEAGSMTVFCRNHPLDGLRQRLSAEGVVTSKELRRIPSGRRVKVTGLMVIVHMPPTKSGKRVIFITLEDETGLMDLVVFQKAQKHHARALLTGEVQTVEGRLQRQGKNGVSTTIIVERVIPHLTGSLAEVLAVTG
ncbi:OB-fold nucleic acid binding domain-containing protein [Thermodesulfobacteriota bacterium]